MKTKKPAAVYVLTASIICLAWCGSPGWGHDSSASVSMVNLRVSAGPTGQEMVTTPSGRVVPLPGAGVSGGTVDIYMGSEGGYWYVDRNGQNFDLTPYVQQLHAIEGQSGSGQSASTSSNNSSNNSNNSNNNGETAAAAGLGAMAGAAAGTAYSNYNNQNSGYQVPYGAAVFYGGGRPYYNGANGSAVYVDNSTNYSVNAAANTSNLKAQQQWYDQQRQANPAAYQNWKQNSPKENPFVASSSNPASGATEGRHGPFAGKGRPGGEASGNSGGPRGGGPFARKEEAPGSGGSGGGPFAGRGPHGGGGGPSGGPFAGKEPPSGGGRPGGGPFAGKEPPSGGAQFAAGGGPKGKPPVRGAGAGPRPPIGGGMPHP